MTVVRRLLSLPLLADLLVTAVVGTFAIGSVFHFGERLWINVPIAVVGTAAMLVRRYRPLAVLGGLAALSVPLALEGRYVLYPALLFALFSVALRTQRPLGLRAALATMATVAVTAIAHERGNLGSLIAPAGFAVAAWVWGENVRRRELERDEQARDAVLAERARIAAELHDVITHNVSSGSSCPSARPAGGRREATRSATAASCGTTSPARARR